MNVDNQHCFNVDVFAEFMSFKDNDEDRVMHSKSDNIEIVINDEADKITEKLFYHFFLHIKLDWKHQ